MRSMTERVLLHIVPSNILRLMPWMVPIVKFSKLPGGFPTFNREGRKAWPTTGQPPSMRPEGHRRPRAARVRRAQRPP